MPSIISQIDADLVVAIKKSLELERDALRMLKSSIHNKEIELGHKLNDQEITSLLQKEIKKRSEAAELYQQASKSDLAKKENLEADLIRKYLPAQLSENQIRLEVDAYLKENPDQADQIGTVIGNLCKKLTGQADGATIARIVKEKLS